MTVAFDYKIETFLMDIIMPALYGVVQHVQINSLVLDLLADETQTEIND